MKIVLTLLFLITTLTAEENKPLYKISIGDTLRISIYGKPASVKDVVVDPYGNVEYLYVGTIKAYGKTIPSLAEEINNKIKDHIKFALVTVSPAELGGRYFYVSGTVNKPGRKVLTPGTTVLAALAQAGGLQIRNRNSISVEMSDLKHAFLLRNGTNIPLNFKELVKKGNLSQNITLEKGDFIYIPHAVKKQVYVLGEVKLQRSIELFRPVSLLQVLSKANGVTDNASSEILVVRGSLTKPAVKKVNYKNLISGKEKDFFLKPDDIVFVPERSTVLAEEMIKLAIRAFVARIATLSGSEVFKEIEADAEAGNTGFDFNLNP